jgi:hypothetical protein
MFFEERGNKLVKGIHQSGIAGGIHKYKCLTLLLYYAMGGWVMPYL